jgi:glutathione synthetase
MAYHLVGSKKIQQVLVEPGVLERYMSPDESTDIRSCFTGLYEVNEETIAMVRSKPGGFVMKPQREGGGNNIYGEDIPAVLDGLNREQRDAYIFMDLIRTPEACGALVRRGEVTEGKVVCELGVYGVFVSQGGKEVMNEACGWLLRTKSEGVDEGGVASGFSVLDSPHLVD